MEPFYQQVVLFGLSILTMIIAWNVKEIVSEMKEMKKDIATNRNTITKHDERLEFHRQRLDALSGE